jgi:putative phosphoesterase
MRNNHEVNGKTEIIPEKEHIIGVISDTHGMLRPDAARALKGSDLILHAGDIDRPEVLRALDAIAPVTAVRGNCDRGPWANELSSAETLEFCGFLFHMLHDLSQLDLVPCAAGIHVIISGHSHIPAITKKDRILYLNPGSAGPRRFSLPVTLARVAIQGKELSLEIISLE